MVPGLGLLNAGAAICTAYGSNAPVMCLTGNIMSHLIGQGRGQLHELPDQWVTLKGLTKWVDRIDHPTEAAAKMTTAFTQMRSGRQRPVAVEMPWDVFGQTGVAPDNAAEPVLETRLDPEKIEAPVASHRPGKGIVSDANPHAMNLISAYEYYRNCDLLIGISSGSPRG